MKRDSIPACDILEYMKNFSSQTQIIGEKGENICASLLKQLGFTIKERNFTVRGGDGEKSFAAVYGVEVTARNRNTHQGAVEFVAQAE
mgnify:CR=1 FL=1